MARLGSSGVPENRANVGDLQACDASLDRVDHLRLDVFRVHDAVWPNAAGQAES
jgi:hypothetical protein